MLKIGGNIFEFLTGNFKIFASISFNNSSQNALPSGSSHGSGKFKIFKKITSKNCLYFIHRYCG
jgi:hypothetical protein